MTVANHQRKYVVQLNEYETAPYFIQFSQNLTFELFVDVCVFPLIPPNLSELNLKLFCSDVQNNFRFSSGKFGEIRGKTQKSTNNHMSSFG